MFNEFDIILLENDILCEKVDLFILKNDILMDTYYESEGITKSDKNDKKKNSFKEKIVNFIKTVINKIKEIFTNTGNAIHGFISSERVTKKLNKLENDIKENPELGKKTVEVPDISEIQRLQEETIDKVSKCSTKEDVEAVMSNYKKDYAKKEKRRKFVKRLAGSMIIGAFTVPVLFPDIKSYIKKCSGKIIYNMDKDARDLENYYEASEAHAKFRKQEIEVEEEEIKYREKEIENREKKIRDREKEIEDREKKIAEAKARAYTTVSHDASKTVTYAVKGTIDGIDKIYT